jgi:hypothetical protein
MAVDFEACFDVDWAFVSLFMGSAGGSDGFLDPGDRRLGINHVTRRILSWAITSR